VLNGVRPGRVDSYDVVKRSGGTLSSRIMHGIVSPSCRIQRMIQRPSCGSAAIACTGSARSVRSPRRSSKGSTVSIELSTSQSRPSISATVEPCPGRIPIRS